MKDFKLKPCPLCGKGFRKNRINAYEHYNEECILHGFEISNEKLLKQWNTRKPIDDIVERLEELYKYNSEQADIYMDGVDAYMREKKEMYMDRANCYGVAIRTVKEVGGSCD